MEVARNKEQATTTMSVLMGSNLGTSVNEDDSAMPALTGGNTTTNTATSLLQLDSVNMDVNLDLPVDFPVLQVPLFDEDNTSIGGKPAKTPTRSVAWSLHLRLRYP